MTASAPPARYAAADLAAFGRGLLEAAGMPPDRAADVADVLVEADLLGHDTHGLNLLPIYLREIEAGSMTLTGDPLTLADRGAAVTWDGRRLPGPWLVLRAYELAAQRARLHGTGTVVIRRSHHVACLAAYLERAAAQGLVLLVYSSGPSTRTVAPFGAHGMKALRRWGSQPWRSGGGTAPPGWRRTGSTCCSRRTAGW